MSRFLRSMRPAVVLLAAVGPLAVAAAADDAKSVDVRDLLPRIGQRMGPSLDPWPDPTGELTIATEEEGSVPEGIDSDALIGIVRALSGIDGISLAPDGHSLVAEDIAPVRAAVQRIRAQRPSPVDVELSLERSDGTGWTTLFSAREPVVAGRWTAVADVEERAGLSEFDVEIAESAQIPDPIVQLSRAGSGLRFVVLPIPGTDEALLECDAAVATRVPYSPMKPGYLDMADMDRIAVTIERTALPARIRSGVPAVVEWHGQGRAPMRLRVAATWRTPPRDGDAKTAVSWAPLLRWNVDEWSHIPSPVRPAKSEESRPIYGGRHELRELQIGERVDEWLRAFPLSKALRTDSGLHAFVAESEGPATAAMDSVAKLTERSFRRVDLRLDAWSVPTGAPSGTAEGAQSVLSGSAPAIAGANALFVVSDAMTYLQDYDVEVAQAARIVDPIVGIALTGTYANVRAEPGADGTIASFDLDIVLARIDSWETQEVEQLVPVRGPHTILDPGAALTKSGGTNSKSADAAALVRTSYVIEKPVVRHTRISVRLPAGPDGSATLRRALPGYLGAGRELLLTVRGR